MMSKRDTRLCPDMWRRLRLHALRSLQYLGNGAIICIGLAIGWALGLQIVGNVHPIEEGIAYRSAQLNGERLTDVIAAHHIKSIINLRGANPGSSWYNDEIRVSTAANVVHLDIGMSALQEPNAATVTKLINALQAAPRPILIHCNSGSDRTGFASALFERFVVGRSTEDSARQLSFRYGHFPWFGNRTVATDRTFQRLSGTASSPPSD
jgi:protein tyrosine phosphatase (PTP) superfamily phosphohydrolase (DUF442 family)